MIKIFTDHTGTSLSLEQAPGRIVSLVPSQTELLFSLGLEEKIVGITRFCRHPAGKVEVKMRIGGTKDFSTEVILGLHPDLVLANKEENEREKIEVLKKSVPVWVSDVDALPSALDMIQQVGAITDRQVQAEALCRRIESDFMQLIPVRQVRTAYFIWRKPYMSIGRDTFIRDMMLRCGLKNVFDDRMRYPVVDAPQLRAADPELILLSSEPYPFGEKHCTEFKELCPQAKILLVDGEMFSWFGSRLLHAEAYFRNLMHRL